MKIHRNGATRTVWEFESFVVKFPNIRYSFRNFLRGMLANIDEAETYKNHPDKNLLCPVKWVSKAGLILVMERADVLRHDLECAREELLPDYYDLRMTRYYKWVKSGFSDLKPSNFGYYKNELVMIDYSK